MLHLLRVTTKRGMLRKKHKFQTAGSINIFKQFIIIYHLADELIASVMVQN